MGTEADCLHRHLQWLLEATLAHDLGRLSQHFTGKSPLDGKIRNNDTVSLVITPSLEQFPADSRLHHGRCGHHHARPDIIKVAGRQVLDSFKQERVAVLRLKRHLDVVVHHLDIRLIHTESASGQTRGLVNGNVVNFRVCLPVVVQDKQQLLRSAQRDHWEEHPPAAFDNTSHHLNKPLLALLPSTVACDAVSGFHDYNVWRLYRSVRPRKMPVSLPGVVAGVQAVHPFNAHHEHACPQHMPSGVWSDSDPIAKVQCLPEVDDLNAVHAGL
mmetsp:Transcript_12461/g.34990  ORF Transcript_12461/g.34990 Transcript_12461/m.34990 type:complete len:271 (-) Transcript_12461:593-1405(-)